MQYVSDEVRVSYSKQMSSEGVVDKMSGEPSEEGFTSCHDEDNETWVRRERERERE